MNKAKNLFYGMFTLIAIIALVLAISGCSTAPAKPVDKTPAAPQVTAPISNEKTATENTAVPVVKCGDCDDKNACTSDLCSADTDYQCKHIAQEPCCGNGKCEAGESASTCPADCKGESKELLLLIQNSARAKSYFFTYVTEDSTEVKYTVKGSKIKQNYLRTMTYNSKQYDTILADSSTSKAYAFCTKYCVLDTYFEMPYDVATANFPVMPDKKLLEIKDPIFKAQENVEGHPAAVMEYKVNGESFRARVWDYYGLMMRVETLNADGTVASKISYKDTQVNSVKDSDMAIPAGYTLAN